MVLRVSGLGFVRVRGRGVEGLALDLGSAHEPSTNFGFMERDVGPTSDVVGTEPESSWSC